ESNDQLHVKTAKLGSTVAYLKEGASAGLHMYNGDVVSAELPAAVELTVSLTEPAVQGDRVSGARKPATLETGLVVQVPLFVEPGEKIKVDTRTGEYQARARAPWPSREAAAKLGSGPSVCVTSSKCATST